MRTTLPLVAGTAALALVLAPAAPLRAATDGRGNTIDLRVEAPGVSGAPYVAALRRAVHGREIEDVTIRVVTRAQVARICGRRAEACYSGSRDGRGVIVVPAATGTAAEATLLHEYGHHLDNAYRHRPGVEPDGTARWWAARGMGARLARGEVAPDYRLGWERGIGEIFAEDYVRLNLALPWRLSSVPAPGTAVLAALRRDITGSATGPAPRDAGPVDAPAEPGSSGTRLVLERAGLLGGGAVRDVPFGLLGPGRSVRAVVAARGEGGRDARVRVTVVCDGRTRGTAVATGRRPGVVARTGLGPGSCRVRLRNLGPETASVSLRLTLTRPRR
jgi:hypothetical protein